jgi:hypothetical protein
MFVVGALVPALVSFVACSGNELKFPATADHGTPARVSAATPAPAHEMAPSVADTPSIADTAPSVADAPSVAEPSPSVADAPSVAEPSPSVTDTPPPAAPDEPLELVATARETLVYAEPSRTSRKVGYLRLGARVRRGHAAVGRDGCAAGWYRVAPYGFVCAGNAASLDAKDLADLARTRPDRSAPLPYVYGRSKPLPPPLYTHLPTKAEMVALEGAAPRDAAGFADVSARPLPALFAEGRPLPEPFGYARTDAAATARALPNSAFALLDVVEHEGRRLGLTTDLELVPLDRLTRVEPSAFHGVVLDEATTLPLVFTRGRRTLLYSGSPARGLRPVRVLDYREAVSITEHAATTGGVRFLETRSGEWIRDLDLVRVTAATAPPAGVRAGRTWVHVSIQDQTLVAYVGSEPVYATLVSTGADGMGDPETSHSTPRGEFVIHTKHVTATMNGDEVGDEFDLRDVPYVEYFTQGYAFHAAYWHDAFGSPHSHGCVNLSPRDARWLFHFTEPSVPQGWHGAFSREGTLVSITP